MDQHQERLILNELQALNRSFKAILTILRNIHGVANEYKDRLKELKEREKSPHMMGKEDG